MLWCVNSAAWCSQVFVCCDCFVCQFSYVRLKIKYRRTEYLDFRREYNIYIYIYTAAKLDCIPAVIQQTTYVTIPPLQQRQKQGKKKIIISFFLPFFCSGTGIGSQMCFSSCALSPFYISPILSLYLLLFSCLLTLSFLFHM